MKTSELIFFVAFSGVLVFVITMLIRDRLRKRRIVGSLAARPQQPDEEFGSAFFSDPKRADIAVRVRRVLSKNLEMPLDGLTPNERLNEDLNAELAANPHLFWDLETEFGIKTDVEDLESHEKTLGRLVTFRDLVDYIESKMSEPRPLAPAADEAEKSSRVYDFAIRSIPILCIGGLLTAIAGILGQKKSLQNFGCLIFMSGFAVWGLANGGEMARTLIQSFRGSRRKEIFARPWPLILLTCLALFFLWVGGVFLWGILKNISSSK